MAIAAAAFAAEIPFFFFGTPSGHDVEFHLYSWLEVLSQWKHGVIFPRWALLANFGYGEPRFLFYPPASWTLGALISALVPFTVASPVYIWIALTAAGAAMFCLARQWFSRRDAIFAAVLYVVNPYHLVIIYWRSAFAELLASSLIPLLLLFVLKAADGRRRAWVPLGIILAAAWLTNAPAAIMMHYSLALLVVWLAFRQRSPRILITAAAAILLGACLSAFYLLPAIYEQRWVTIAQAIGEGSRPQESFLFIRTTDAAHDAFNHIISWIALLEMLVVACAAYLASKNQRLRSEVCSTIVLWAGAASLLMFPISALAWRVLPKLAYLQFPWRWLLCLSMIFTLLVTAGMRSWWQRIAVCVLYLAVIAFAWNRIQAPWWDAAADLREMQDNMADKIGYEGVEEYTPLEANPSAMDNDNDKEARNVTVVGSAHAAIRVTRWDAENRQFTADLSSPDQLALKLFAYPAWKVEVNGHPVDVLVRGETGQILIPVDAGPNRISITFARTWDRTAAGWISLITAACLLGWTRRILYTQPAS